jgi:hypothetical protein
VVCYRPASSHSLQVHRVAVTVRSYNHIRLCELIAAGGLPHSPAFPPLLLLSLFHSSTTMLPSVVSLLLTFTLASISVRFSSRLSSRTLTD